MLKPGKKRKGKTSRGEGSSGTYKVNGKHWTDGIIKSCSRQHAHRQEKVKKFSTKWNAIPRYGFARNGKVTKGRTG
jgi:hypothetical protein